MLEDINKQSKYVVTENCKLLIEDDKESKNFGKVKIIPGTAVGRVIGNDFSLDKRFNLISTYGTNDIEEYVRYYGFFLNQVESLLLLENPTGRFITQLDMGYIPVFAPPTYLYRALVEEFKKALTAVGLKYIEKPAMRLDGTGINADCRDLWVSRLDIAKLLGKHPCAVKIMELLEMIIPHMDL